MAIWASRRPFPAPLRAAPFESIFVVDGFL